ncbi:MAG: hypothetical protein WCI03_03860 [bacterium]|jgi:ElaB/YqjD/DUF883 family membrane-anchored ribosome-binding protein
MDHTSNEKIAEALKLLEEAAKQKKDELRTVMSDKYTNLRDMIIENESSLMKALINKKDHAIDAVSHAKDVSIEKAREMADDVNKSVHHNPWAYIAGTAAVGLALGYLLGRNRK